MSSVDVVQRGLERWCVGIFLVAGLMAFVSTANNVLGAYTPLVTQEGTLLAIEAFAGFGGVMLAFVGLVGLYPRLAARAREPARIGVALVLLPVAFFGLLVTCAIPAELLGFPSPRAVLPAFGAVTMAVFLLSAAGIGIFGLVALRSRTLSRAVGSSLLVFAISWVVFLGTSYQSGFPIPDHVTVTVGAMQTVALLGIGYGLRAASGATDHPDPTPDPAA